MRLFSIGMVDLAGTGSSDVVQICVRETGARPIRVDRIDRVRLRYSCILLIVSRRTAAVPDNVDADRIFHACQSASTRVILILMDVATPKDVFTRASTLAAIADLHSIFTRSDVQSADQKSLRKQLQRVRRAPLARFLTRLAQWAAIGTATTLFYVYLSALPTLQYEIAIWMSGDHVSIHFNGRTGTWEELSMHIMKNPKQKIIVKARYGSLRRVVDTFDQLQKAGVDLAAVEFEIEPVLGEPQ